jgi:hypothetical protein
MSTQVVARLRLAGLWRPTVALESKAARLQILTARLPEARAIARIDRERTPRALTIHVLTDCDE